MAGVPGLLGLRPRPSGQRRFRAVVQIRLRRICRTFTVLIPAPLNSFPCRLRRQSNMAGVPGLLGLRLRPSGQRRLSRRCSNPPAADLSNLYGSHPGTTELFPVPPSASIKYGWGARIRTWECWDQNPVPYRLATPQYFQHISRARITRAAPSPLRGQRRFRAVVQTRLRRVCRTWECWDQNPVPYRLATPQFE